ncbi:Alpha-glucosidase, partial [Frankliniella fusca]
MTLLGPMTRASSKPLTLPAPCRALAGPAGPAPRMQRYYAAPGMSLRRPPMVARAQLVAAPAAPGAAAPGPHALLVLPPPPLVDSCPADKSSRSSTWTSYGASSALGSAIGSSKTFSSELERGERIKPERANRRNAVQKMQWRSSRWVTGFAAGEYLGEYPAGPGQHQDAELDHRISSMTIADVSPRFAVKRILLLYENQQHREAANFINRLSHGTFKVIVNDLPIDLFVESMPASLSILEALYAKVFLSDGLDFSLKLLRPEAVVMQMVRLFAGSDANNSWQLCGPFVTSCKKLLKVIVLSEPKIRKMLQARRRALDKAIEGLGQHGLVGTSDETLMNLHDALKVEFSRVVETYKGAMQKLEDLSLAGQNAATGINRGPAPVQASHQRQLSLRQPEIQERLIKNKTLLNVVEPTMGNHSLDILLGILQRRIECDKDALFQFTQLKKEARSGVSANDIVAPVLMRFSHGCDQ